MELEIQSQTLAKMSIVLKLIFTTMLWVQCFFFNLQKLSISYRIHKNYTNTVEIDVKQTVFFPYHSTSIYKKRLNPYQLFCIQQLY